MAEREVIQNTINMLKKQIKVIEERKVLVDKVWAKYEALRDIGVNVHDELTLCFNLKNLEINKTVAIVKEIYNLEVQLIDMKYAEFED